MRSRAVIVFALVGCSSSPPAESPPPPTLCPFEGSGDGGAGTGTVVLGSDWKIRSSVEVAAGDAEVATGRISTQGWFDARVPSTVMGSLVDDGRYTDVNTGMNLRSLPGMDYPVGREFAYYEMADSNPFKAPWWYRTVFPLPPSAPGSRAWLRFQGVNNRASVFLNGRRVASESDLSGTYRQFEYDVTNQVSSCGDNVLAVKVRAQTLSDLGWNFVDWMPFPPDKLLGLWRPVSIVTTGPVRLRWPQVETHLAMPEARLTLRAELENATDEPIDTTLTVSVEGRSVAQAVKLAAREKREVTISPDDHPELVLASPRLWWPVHMGTQELYFASFSVDAGGRRSDETRVRFGVREVTSELTAEGYRLFRVNGEKVLIRGAGWTPDMMLQKTDERIAADLRYARDMNLNAIRLEGKVGFEPLYDLADELGLFVLGGWCCCDRWEDWDNWTDENRRVAVESMRDQGRLLRNHPSALIWIYGSDGTPPPDIEKAYADTLKEIHWPNPSIATVSVNTTALNGPSGVKMLGPYKWEPPSYWSEDKLYGGAFGFNTETSIGEAIPPVESLKRMLGPGHDWPIDDTWYFHLGTNGFGHMEPYLQPLAARYGASIGLSDLAARSQLSSYEGVRAMFEAYGRNKYHATGVIQWMLNNGWPGVIWHLYDFYLKPGGGYFAAKLANEPLHIQYGYEDHAVVVVSSYREDKGTLTATARVVDLTGQERYRTSQKVAVGPDATITAFALPDLANLTTTYFVDLRLDDAQGNIVSRNFYWLSTVPDVLDYSRAELALVPTSSNADLTGLNTLPMTSVDAVVTRTGSDVRVRLKNTGNALAFFVRVTIADAKTGDELVPVHWSDNYVSLWPGEERELTVPLPLSAAPPVVHVAGWNVADTMRALP